MTDKKDRVIAIDYFRGLAMLAVILNHGAVFTYPYTYLVGEGRLWTGAAEMFFLLSGITLWIVRGDKLVNNFKNILLRTWKRAASIYAISVIIAILSLSIAVLLTARNLPVNMPEAIPTVSLGKVVLDMLTLKYSFGWASFLMYYSIYMLIAPFALWTLKTKAWFSVPVISALFFALTLWSPVKGSPYFYFFVWQVYFFLGLTIGRLRLPILNAYRQLPKQMAKVTTFGVVAVAGTTVMLSAFLTFKTDVLISKVAGLHFVPSFIKSASVSLYGLQTSFNQLFQENRSGVLRPLAAVVVLAGAYVVYQRYKAPLLKRTGWFVNAIGRNSLWIFAGQALVIPILAAFPMSRNVVSDSLMTATLIYLMWLITKRDIMAMIFRGYANQLSSKASDLKYAFIYRLENNN